MIGRITAEIAALSHEGGWVLWGLIALAFGIAFSLMSVWQGIRLSRAPLLPGREWRRLLGRKEAAADSLDLFRQTLLAKGGSVRLEELRHRLFDRPSRHVVFAFVLVTAAPLIGLLGTVTGMFTTFSGMARGAGAPIDAISRGISEALVTTQTGLIIGVPSFIVCSLLKHRLELLRLRFERLSIQVAGSLPGTDT